MPKRNAGIRSDTNGFRRYDMVRLLTKIRNGDNIWPVKLVPGGLPYVLYHGFRRFYASIAVGFSHIPRCLSGTTIKVAATMRSRGHICNLSRCTDKP